MKGIATIVIVKEEGGDGVIIVGDVRKDAINDRTTCVKFKYKKTQVTKGEDMGRGA